MTSSQYFVDSKIIHLSLAQAFFAPFQDIDNDPLTPYQLLINFLIIVQGATLQGTLQGLKCSNKCIYYMAAESVCG